MESEKVFKNADYQDESDLTIRVESTVFRVHHKAMSKFSKVFQLSAEEFGIVVPEMRLTLHEADVIENLLSISYYGDLFHDGTKCEIETFHAAAKYKMEEAQKFLTDRFLSNIHLGNYLQLKELAERYNIESLADKFYEYCSQCFNKIIFSWNFKRLDESTLASLLGDKDILVDDEEAVLNAIKFWVDEDDRGSEKFDSLMGCLKAREVTTTNKNWDSSY